MQINKLTIARYEDVLALLRRTPGVSVREVDSREGVERYLRRNPGLSFVAEIGGQVVGCAMCGHDGRRGYLQHVVVDLEHRRRGIARALVDRCLAALKAEGIVKAHLDVFVTNSAAQRYWENRGWKRRDDIYRYSIIDSESANA